MFLHSIYSYRSVSHPAQLNFAIIVLEKRKQLKARTILERKRINCKIIETGAEIVS